MLFPINVTSYSYDSYYVWEGLMINTGLRGSGHAYLFEEGCYIKGKTDCRAACEHPESVWNTQDSIFTLHNCMMYPIIIQMYNADNLTSDSIDIAAQFNIVPTDVSDKAMNTETISTCITDFCNTANAKNTPGCFPPHSLYEGSTYFSGYNCTGRENDTAWDGCNAWFYLKYNPWICADVARNLGVNLDMSGIGMLVAYIIQVAVVLLTCLLWHCLQDWSKLGIFIHTKVWRRSKDPWMLAEKSQAKLKKTKLYASFVKALAEFQKAQVFFLAAVLVAALIAWFHPMVLSNDPDQQLDQHDQQRATAALSKNLNMFIDLAYAGAFPIVLGMLTLRNAGKRDTYTLVISTFPLILSVILLIATADQLNSQTQVIVTPSGGPESCAGVKPTDYCFPSTYSPTMLARIGGWPLVACFVVFFCIVLERVKLFKDHNKPAAPKRISGNQANPVARMWGRIKDSTVHRQNIFEAVRDWTLRRQRLWVRYERLAQDSRWLRWTSAIQLDTAESLVHIIGKIVVLAAEITLGAFNVILLYEYARIIRPKEYRVSDFQVWTLGQVIAVTVWFPVLVEFIWDCYDGIAKTLESRILPDTYRVVTIDQPTAPSQDDAASLTCLPPITPYKALQTDPLQP